MTSWGGVIRPPCMNMNTWTFQSIQNYLYKLSGKSLSWKVIVRETSVTPCHIAAINCTESSVAQSVARSFFNSPRSLSCSGSTPSSKRFSVRHTPHTSNRIVSYTGHLTSNSIEKKQPTTIHAQYVGNGKHLKGDTAKEYIVQMPMFWWVISLK